MGMALSRRHSADEILYNLAAMIALTSSRGSFRGALNMKEVL